MSPFPDFNRINDTRFGRMIYNVNDRYIGRSIQSYGEFSHGEVVLFEQILRPGSVVVEAGANIGSHTLALAQQTGPRGAVFAFEPQRILFQTLCGNMALNSVTNARCSQAALGSESGEIIVPQIDYCRENNYGGFALGSYERGERVSLVTIDGLSLPRCDLIKIDVEGMEESVLRGAQETIARFRPPLYVECHDDASLMRYIDSIDYDMYWHMPPFFNPNNFAGNRTNIFGSICSQNILCVTEDLDHSIDGLQRVELPDQQELS